MKPTKEQVDAWRDEAVFTHDREKGLSGFYEKLCELAADWATKATHSAVPVTLPANIFNIYCQDTDAGDFHPAQDNYYAGFRAGMTHRTAAEVKDMTKAIDNFAAGARSRDGVVGRKDQLLKQALDALLEAKRRMQNLHPPCVEVSKAIEALQAQDTNTSKPRNQLHKSSIYEQAVEATMRGEHK